MPLSPARKIAYEILRRVESGRGYAIDLLQRREVSELKDADRRLATEIVMGVLRWRGELDFHIERLSSRPLKRLDPEVITILRMGIYQIRFLSKVPRAAVVNEAVELTKAARKRSAAGLVNAALRKCPTAERRLDAVPFEDLSVEEKESISRTVPAWLLERWTARAALATNTGAEKAGPRSEADPELPLRLAWAGVQVPATTLRVARLGSEASDGEQIQQVRQELAAEGIPTRAPEGRFAARAVVVESGNVLASRAFCEGRVVIQDAASQLVAELVAPQTGQRVLDLCAAPGVKSGQIAQTLGRGEVVACDLSPSRLRTLLNLLPPQVPPAVRLHLVRLDATRPLPFGFRFDRILLDVPCSGTGTLSRNPEIKWRLRPGDIPRLADAQQRMLRNGLEVLTPGGRLVYSTCSLEPEENEKVVENVLTEATGFRMLTHAELARQFPALAPLFDSRGYFRTHPGREMDGFFAAVIVRTLC